MMGHGEGFFLGGVIDPATGERRTDPVHYEPDHLTTHGVIVGMTGSGKTGLGLVFLEEALGAGIPTLVLDPKGDMANLLLAFPDLQPADFRPWVDEGEARRRGISADDLAAETARTWESGLRSWGLGGADIAALRRAAEFTVYTPGSVAGIPLNVVGSMAAPEDGFEAAAEALHDEIEGFVSGLLGLVGIEGDPIASREHVLLANLIERAWAAGEGLTLEDLIARVQRPPLRKLGVFEVDTFFPEKDRLDLAMRLNSLIASPSFAAWRAGPPLHLPSLLWGPGGKPRAAVIYMAHLSDAERQFVVALVLSRLITWMRAQPGSSDLRLLVYMDEVFGFAPPSAAPPAKKPILTLLKTARAFGVGMLLATQNPMDLDYKAMSNAGTWCIGRLQTERDKARILEALQPAAGDRDLSRLDALVSGLGKRQFLLHETRRPEPLVFTTRWALCYLRGPLTREEIADLTEDDPLRRAVSPDAPVEPGATALAENESRVPPEVADGVPTYHLDPAAPWAGQIGALRGGKRLAAALVARAHLVFDDSTAGLRHNEEWEAVFHPLGDHFDPAGAVDVDYDHRDFLAEPPEGATYLLPAVPVASKAFFTDAAEALRQHLYRNRTVDLLHNRALKLYSRVGESAEGFAARCDAAAQEAADREAAKIRDRLAGKMRALRGQIEEARLKTEDAHLDLENRRREEVASGAGDLIGVLLGGRRSTRSLSTAAGKRSMTRKAQQRLMGAEARLAGKIEDLDDLEDALAVELVELDAAWAARGAEIETLEVGLERSDVSVEEISLLWVPVSPA